MENLKKYDIVLAPSHLKNELLSLKLTSLENNFKIIDKKTLIDHLCFSYDNRAVLYLFNKGIRFENCKEIISSMYFIDERDRGINKKISTLLDYKNELKALGFLKENPQYRNVYSKKNILVKGYDKNDKIIDLLKRQYSLNMDYDGESYNKQLKVIVFDNVEFEIRYLFENIFKLYLDNKIPLNRIKVIASGEPYVSLLRKYQNFYNIHFNFESELNYYNSSEYKEFKNILSTTIIDQAFEFAYDKFKDSPYIEKLLQKYIEVKDFIKVEDVEHYFDYLAKNIKLKPAKYKNGIDVISISEVKTDDYVFLLGFNIDSYPRIFKDDDYLSDLEKEKLGISTSFDEQKYAEKELINQLYKLDNLNISYSKKYRDEVFFPSLLMEKLKMEQVKDYKFGNTIYSKRHFDYFMGMLYDDERNFSYRSPYLNSITTEELKYLSYDSSFKQFNIPKLKEKLLMSYSRIQTFFECPFKYYLSYLCKADEFVGNIYVILGDMVHKMFEDYAHGALKKYDFYLDEQKDLTEVDKYILSQNKQTVEYAIKRFIEFYEKTSLKQLHSEVEGLVYTNENGDRLSGKVDMIMSNEDNYAIIDFKTGNAKIDKNLIDIGLNMQLPLYYVMTSANENYKNKQLSGLYYYHIINKDYYKQNFDYLLLDGLTISSEDYFIVQGDERFVSKAKPFGKEEFEELIEGVRNKFDEACEKIHNANFKISPARDGKACENCPFFDVCFKDISDQDEEGGE